MLSASVEGLDWPRKEGGEENGEQTVPTWSATGSVFCTLLAPTTVLGAHRWGFGILCEVYREKKQIGEDR